MKGLTPDAHFMKTCSSTLRTPAAAIRWLLALLALDGSLATAQAQIGANWRLLNPRPWSDQLTSVVALSPTRVIAIGQGTGLLVSNDGGVTWAATRVDYNAEFGSDAYVASNSDDTKQVLVVGSRVFTATTGEDWTEVSTNLTSNESLSFVTLRGGTWAAIKRVEDPSTGQTDYFLVTAPLNGDTWTVASSLPLPSGSNTLNAMIVQGSVVIVGGTNYNSATATTSALLLRTADGTTWNSTALTDAADTAQITSFARSDTTMIAGSYDKVYVSTDVGFSWSRRDVSGLARVAWNGSRFVGASASVSRYSSDGSNWTDSTTAYGALTPLAMAKVGTGVVAVGYGGSVFTTTDGDVWTQRSPTGSGSDLTRITTNPAGIKIAFPSSGQLIRSTDGTTWTAQSTNAKAAVWFGSQFVGISNNDCLTSADGITWDDHFVFGSNSMQDISTDGTTVVAVGGAGTGVGKIYTSTNPTVSWTSATVPATASSLYAVTRSGSTWVAVGSQSTILTSTNGTTWTKRTASGAPLELSIVAGNSTGTMIIALSGSYAYGEYFTSTNGTTWTRRRLPTSLDITGAIWTGTSFLVSTTLNIVFSSTDGINWTSSLLPTGNYILGMGWDAVNKEAFLLGGNGTILSSDLVPEASFATGSQSVFESTLNADVQVNLTVAPTSMLTIPFTISGTAIDGSDFTSFASTSVTFAPGEKSKTINVTLVNDSTGESDKTIIFTLSATTGMRVGNVAQHTLTILDDDNPPIAQFVGSAVSVPELAGSIGLQVALNHPASAEVVIPMTTSGAPTSSLNGSSVTIPAGASTAFILLPITPSSSVTNNDVGTVTLGTPSFGTAGSNNVFTVTVLDQDPATTPGRRWALQQQKPSADELWSLTTIPGATPRVVAVGDGGTVVTSDDGGTTWTKRFTNVSPEVQYIGVHWNGSFMIAAGTRGHIGISPDGIAWSDQVMPGATPLLHFSGAASNSTRTVIAGGDVVGGIQVPVIYNSQDSVHWTRAALPSGLKGFLNCVIYVSGTTPEFIAVGSDYNYATSTSTTLILTSANGLSWTDRSAALLGADLSSVIAAGSTLVAFDGSKNAWSGVIAPADGSITWTKRTLGSIGGLAYGAWNGSQLAAVGEATGISTNGIAWTEKASPSKNAFNDITWTGSKFVAIAYPSGIYTSVDGVVWTPPAATETPLTLFSVTWSGTQFCAVGGDIEREKTALIYTSPDGVIWTQRASTLKVPLIAITWSGTQFCAVGANGTITTSPNGITWVTRSSGTTLDLHDVIWATNQFVAVGGNETNEDNVMRVGGSIVLTSKDGITWTRRNIPTGHSLESVVFNPSSPISTGPPATSGPLFIAVGRSTFDGGSGDAEVLTSTDAITWTHRSSGLTNADFQRISRTPNGYAATTSNFGICLSSDGVSWSSAVLPAAPATSYTNALHGITFTGGQIIAVGGSGSIVTSPDGSTWTAQTSQVRTGELFGVAASSTTVVAVGSNGSIQTSTFAPSAAVPVVNFAQASSTVNESGGSVSILVTLSAPPSVATTVVWHGNPGLGLLLTGTGADVTLPASPLVFNPGETTKYLTIAIKSDTVQESDETLTLMLDSITGGGAILGSQVTHALTIANDDVAPVATGTGGGISLEASTVTLRANVTAGSQPLTYLWKKNGAMLPATTIGATSAAVYFPFVMIADGGTYTCTISNAAGSTTITVPLGVIRSTGFSLPYAGTTTATLVQPASSNVLCRWFKDGSVTELAPSADFVFTANKSTLTVKNLASHTGTYACTVELPSTSPLISAAGQSYAVTTTTAAPTLASLTTLQAGIIGTSYLQTVPLAMGSSPVNTWSSPDLASVGLSIDPVSGRITGMPNVVATNKVVTIIATNGKGSTTIKPTITITSNVTPFVGTHTGLMARNPSLNNDLGGIVTVTVNPNGTCTGSFTVGTVKTSFTGVAEVTSSNEFKIQAPVSIGSLFVLVAPNLKAGNTMLSMSFTYDSTSPGPSGTGKFRLEEPATGFNTSANLRTWRALTGAANITPYIGRWNYALRLANSGDVGNAHLPQGHSFGSDTVAASGTVTHTVKLSDGTSVTSSSPLNADGSSALYSLLYSNKGSLMAAPQIDNPTSVDSTITDLAASWNKPADTAAGARNYPQGWAPISLKLQGAKYKYVTGTSVMNLTSPTDYPYVNASLTFAEGGTQATLPEPDVHLNINDNGSLAQGIYSLLYGYNPRSVTFAITPATGAITGTLNMNETQGNGVTTTKRSPIAYNAQIVRIYNDDTSSFDTMGLGYVLLPQLPNLNQSPIPAETTTPILSGRVEVKKYP